MLYCTDLYFCFMFLLSLASCCSVSWKGSVLLLAPATEAAVMITGRRDITATILSTLSVYWWMSRSIYNIYNIYDIYRVGVATATILKTVSWWPGDL